MNADQPEIIFCDSDLDWSRGLRSHLRAGGARVTATAMVRVLNRLFLEGHPDLLVLGEFPDLESEFLIRVLRENHPDLQIILLLNRAGGDLKALTEDLNLLLAAPKPVPVTELLGAMAPTLERSRAASQTPDRPLVLCVDDDLLYLEGLTRLLRSRGYRVVPYSDPELAVESLPLIHPDLIILDVLMKGMTGLQLAEEIREVYGPRIPVIFLTALDSDGEIRRGYRSGASGYLTKPSDPASVLDAVHRVLERRLPNGTPVPRLNAEVRC